MQLIEAEIKHIRETSDGQKRRCRDPTTLQTANGIHGYGRVARKIRSGKLSPLAAVGNQSSKPPAVLSILILDLPARHGR
ncbi:hypothetical protein Psuf_009980 [Phytohabitans suffuscus]|uniref:Uncharacterized protein n=1 Tax=Phytohabitans suffuscus TaxID=624315 RepID=A0A6F8YC42_9ACTN|nr:hypothetical protein Psuf_009980 [Phytohabitans suffuscus]